jgi:hypothetical protein
MKTPLICERCHKKFLCQARVSGKYPVSDCETVEKCVCENCNPANRKSPSCHNIPFEMNPSRRDN